MALSIPTLIGSKDARKSETIVVSQLPRPRRINKTYVSFVDALSAVVALKTIFTWRFYDIRAHMTRALYDEEGQQTNGQNTGACGSLTAFDPIGNLLVASVKEVEAAVTFEHPRNLQSPPACGLLSIPSKKRTASPAQPQSRGGMNTTYTLKTVGSLEVVVAAR